MPRRQGRDDIVAETTARNRNRSQALSRVPICCPIGRDGRTPHCEELPLHPVWPCCSQSAAQRQRTLMCACRARRSAASRHHLTDQGSGKASSSVRATAAETTIARRPICKTVLRTVDTTRIISRCPSRPIPANARSGAIRRSIHRRRKAAPRAIAAIVRATTPTSRLKDHAGSVAVDRLELTYRGVSPAQRRPPLPSASEEARGARHRHRSRDRT